MSVYQNVKFLFLIKSNNHKFRKKYPWGKKGQMRKTNFRYYRQDNSQVKFFLLFLIDLFHRYVDHLSLKATEVCSSHGKKTLNTDHILEALKLINFNSHIKKLQGELDLNNMENEENTLTKKESNALVCEDSIGMKDLINKKRKNKKDKKTFEFSEDMLKEQDKLFEKSKIENMQNILMRGTSTTGNRNNISTYEENAVLKEDNKKLKLDIMEKNLFANDKKTYEEEVDFD